MDVNEVRFSYLQWGANHWLSICTQYKDHPDMKRALGAHSIQKRGEIYKEIFGCSEITLVTEKDGTQRLDEWAWENEAEFLVFMIKWPHIVRELV